MADALMCSKCKIERKVLYLKKRNGKVTEYLRTTCRNCRYKPKSHVKLTGKLTSDTCMDGCKRHVLPDSNYCQFHKDSRVITSRIQKLKNTHQTRVKAAAVQHLKRQHTSLKQKYGAKRTSSPEAVLLISTSDSAQSERFLIGDDDPNGHAFSIVRTKHGRS